MCEIIMFYVRGE